MSRILCVAPPRGDMFLIDKAQEEFVMGDVDYMIFMGGYTGELIDLKSNILTLDAVSELTKYHGDKVIALLSGSDISALSRANRDPMIGNLYMDAMIDGIYQPIWQFNNYLFSSAGISKDWCASIFEMLNPLLEQNLPLADALNSLWLSKDVDAFNDRSWMIGGQSFSSSPFYAICTELKKGIVSGYNQVITTYISNYQEKLEINGYTIFTVNEFVLKNKYLILEI